MWQIDALPINSEVSSVSQISRHTLGETVYNKPLNEKTKHNTVTVNIVSRLERCTDRKCYGFWNNHIANLYADLQTMY